MKPGSLIQGIFGRPAGAAHDYASGPGLFPQLDLDRISKRLNIEREAKFRGEQEIPPSATKVFDDVEQRIVTSIESEIKQSHQLYTDHLKTYGDRIQSLDFQAKYMEIAAAAESAVSDFKACASRGADLLFQLRRDIVMIEEEIRTFRNDNRLNRTARTPQSRVLQYGVVMILLCIEAALNGSMLAVGHHMGLFGGLAEALLIAGLNVWFFGVVMGGFFLRQSHHRSIMRKTAGIAGLALFAAIVLCFNLAVAHYRDALGGDAPQRAAYTALESLLSNPVGIQDFRSWMLFLAGSLFSFAGAYDGLRMDDPYPGYGRIACRQIEIQDLYVEQKQDLMDELQDIRDEAIDKMEAAGADIPRSRGEYYAVIETRSKLPDVFRRHLVYLEQCANELLAQYRTANQKARTTPPPEHFFTDWKTTLPMEPEINPNGSAAAWDGQGPVGFAPEELEKKRRQVHEAFDKAVMEYKRIEELTPEALQR